MLIYRNDDESMSVSLKLSGEEWSNLLKRRKVSRVVGYSKGYFRLTISLMRIEDPYKGGDNDE